MGKRFLIDTNILIYFFDNLIPREAENVISKIFCYSFNISVISKIEFLSWHKFNETQLKKAEGFINGAQVFGLAENIVRNAIALKRRKRIRLPDAIIAATCITNDYTLVTRNAQDFKGVENIRIYNPFERQ